MTDTALIQPPVDAAMGPSGCVWRDSKEYRSGCKKMPPRLTYCQDDKRMTDDIRAQPENGKHSVGNKPDGASRRTLLRAIALPAVTASFLFALSFGLVAQRHSVGPGPRRAFPNVTMRTLKGGVWELSQHRGDVVLINFWATWCPPCRQETPTLVKLSKEYGPKGLDVVGVSMDEAGSDDVRPFVAAFGIPYSILLLPEQSSLRSMLSGLPTTILLDQKGRVAYTYVGAIQEDAVRMDIERLLSAKPTADVAQ